MSASLQERAPEVLLEPERVRAALADVLARAEFQPPQRTWRDWLADRWSEFVDWLGDLFGLSGRSTATAALYVLGALAVAALVWLVIRHWRRGRTSPATMHASRTDERALRAAEWLARARAARQRGDLATALRCYFTALVVGLSEQGRLEYRDSWTYRELLERGAPRGDVRGVLAPLVPRLDAVSFGRATPELDEVERLDALCRQWLGGVAV